MLSKINEFKTQVNMKDMYYDSRFMQFELLNGKVIKQMKDAIDTKMPWFKANFDLNKDKGNPDPVFFQEWNEKLKKNKL